MKKIIFVAIVLFIANVTKAQDDLVIDESLIVNILDVTNKGYIPIKELPKAEKLDINESDAKIVSFEFVHTTRDGKLVEIKNQGAEFSEQLKLRLGEMKIGSKFKIENIIIDNSSGRVLAKPALFTIKS